MAGGGMGGWGWEKQRPCGAQHVDQELGARGWGGGEGGG